MDSTDLPYEVFHTIFITPQKFSPATILQIVQWNQALDPSFSIVKGQFQKFIRSEENNSSKISMSVIETLNRLCNAKCPRNFIRAYLFSLKQIYEDTNNPAQKILVKQEEQLYENWKSINVEILEPYFEGFKLRDKVGQAEINQFVEGLIEKKMYNNCLGFLKFLGISQNKSNIEKLVGKMSNKRDASKAADYVKNLKLNPKDYPALEERLYKNTARHFLKKHGWEYSEQIFEDYPEALACIVEDLLFKKKIKEAKSIWSRHQLWDYLQKEESREILKNQLEKEEELPVNFLQVDQFGPPNQQKFLHLSQFGFEQVDVVWVDSNTHNLNLILDEIIHAQFLGIDTQSIVGQTKFEKVQEAALIQISTGKKIFLFDGFKSSSPQIAQVFETCLSSHLIIGHSFSNDTFGLSRAFGIDPKKEVRVKNMVDICKVYKNMHPQSKYSSLAHICKQILGKELSKEQTLTNWKRRPLRRSQIHYAALDAHVVIEVYNKFVKDYGQMVQYYAQLDQDSL